MTAQICVQILVVSGIVPPYGHSTVYVFFVWAVGKARQMFRTIKQKS